MRQFPVMRLALRLQRQLSEQRRRNTILSCAYAPNERQRGFAIRCHQRQQLHVPACLLQLARDDVALRDDPAHTIQRLEQADG